MENGEAVVKQEGKKDETMKDEAKVKAEMKVSWLSSFCRGHLVLKSSKSFQYD